jgi:hypothetical protein
MKYWVLLSLTLAGLAADPEPTNWRQASSNHAWGIRRGNEGWGQPGGGFRQESLRHSAGMTSYSPSSPIRPQMIFVRPEKLSRSAPIEPVSARRPQSPARRP